MPQLRSLDLGGTPLGDTDEELFQGLSGLTRINLSGTAAGDRVLPRVAGLPELTFLNLSGTAVTDEGLKQLSGHQKLQMLSLEETSISDAGLAALKTLPALRMINVRQTGATLDGYVGLLAANPDLRLLPIPEHFSAENAEIYEALRADVAINGKPASVAQAIAELRAGQHVTGWTGLASQLKEGDFALLNRLPNLNSITVTNEMENISLQPLSRIAERLTSLSLRGKGLGDRELQDLAGLHQLKRLHLAETQISPAGLKAIRSLPLVALRIEGSKSVTMGAIVEAFPNLRELSVEKCSLADGDIAQVAALQQLEVLNLSLNSTYELTASALKKLPRLRWFSVPCLIRS